MNVLSKFDFGEQIGIIVWKRWYPALINCHHNFATTYDFPVRLKFIETYRIPDNKWDQGSSWNLKGYIECAKELEKDGVAAICTNCGLTGDIQEDLTDAVDIPVFTSSLLQVPFVARSLGKGKKVGILVADADYAYSRNKKLLKKCGIDESISYVLRGMEQTENEPIWGTQFGRGLPYKIKKVEKIMISEIKKMILVNPEIRAIVLECTEMPIYSAAVRIETGLPVFDSSTMVRYIYHAIVKKHHF